MGFAAFWIAVASGQRGGESLLSNLWLTGPMAVAVAAAVGGGVTGLVALIGHGDRSVGIVAATVIGLLVTLWVGLEIAFPH